MTTKIAIIGGGPAGLFLSQLLHLQNIDSVILERRSREYVLGRIRAGVLEQGTVDLMRRAGVGDRIEKEGMVHSGIGIAFDNAVHHIDLMELTGGSGVTVYGQTEITHDLYAARDAMDGIIIDQAEDVELHDIDSDSPYVTYTKEGEIHRIDCDFIAGCDGFHGVSRKSIPEQFITEYHMAYPFGWLGVLSETPPASDEVIYAHHDRGFALCSMRNKMLSRYYIQVDLDQQPEDWSDEQFWDEFKLRLPDRVSESMITGSSIEKSIAPLRAFVADNLNYGRLFLAGDAGHIVPPTGAKGLNLAASDVHYLSQAFIEYYRSGGERDLGKYSERALDRIWKCVRFSMWCTLMLHTFQEHTPFERRIQKADLQYLLDSRAAQKMFAENYIGLPY
ncbi:MAG: 4-hydroxybenzoate 3-monooxygenase [bacterium]